MAGPSSSSRPAACSGLMYAGVPSAEPICVAAEPLVEDGMSVRSAGRRPFFPMSERLGQAPVDDQGLAILARA